MTKEQLLAKTIVDDNGCFIWQAAYRNKNSYGVAKHNGKVVDTHRLSWILHYGDIPQGLYVCHKCDVRGCINPEHLFLGTPKQNILDAINKNRLYDIRNAKKRKGYRAVNAKIPVEIVIEIKKRIADHDYEKLIDLSTTFDVPYQTIRDINTGRSYNTPRYSIID
jgi:hypothetical protein